MIQCISSGELSMKAASHFKIEPTLPKQPAQEPLKQGDDSPQEHPASRFDFRTEGPPLHLCERCTERFQDWRVIDTEWNRLPRSLRDLILCETCFAREFSAAGHDPKDVKISRKSWKRRRELWEATNTASSDSAHVHFDWKFKAEGNGVPRETMWCQVLDFEPSRRFRIRLENDSYVFKSLRAGTELDAVWDGLTVHAVSGRPILQPLCYSEQQEPLLSLDVISALQQELCPECDAAVGEFHRPGCDVERCPYCAGEFLICGHEAPDDDRLRWTGRWPGEEECEEWGWFARLVPGKGWVRCKRDDLDASPDLNRLDKDARWDRANKKWVRRTPSSGQDQGKVE